MSWKKPPGYIGANELSRALGISAVSVRSYAKQGMPHRRQGRQFLFHLDGARAWYEENKLARGRRVADSPSPRVSDPPPESRAAPGLVIAAPPRMKIDDEYDSMSPAELGKAHAVAKLRETEAKAAKHKFDLEVKRGLYLEKAKVKEDLLRRIQVVKGGLLALTSKLPAQLVGLDEAEVAAKIEEEIRGVLTAFAKGGT